MSENQLKVWRQKRGQTKRCMTVLEKWLTSLSEDYKLNSIVDGEVKIEDLKQWRITFEDCHNGMTECMVNLEREENELSNHEKEFEHFEERYSTALSALVNLVEAAKKDLRPVQQPQQADNATQVIQQPRMQTSLKLPEIHLPFFDGQLVNYQAFKETFKALVHNDVRLSAIQKFFYLKGCLKNTSMFAEISSLELTEENYSLAWDLLKTRFENRKALINKHIKYLFNLPKAERNSASSLRQLIDNVSKHIHGIKAQQIVIPDAILIYIVSSRIDELTHQLWEAHDANTNIEDVATFESLKHFISNRARALENVEDFSQRKPSQPAYGQAATVQQYGSKKYQDRNKPDKKQTLAAVQGPQTDNDSGKTSCVFCRKPHRKGLWGCDDFLSKHVEERIQFIKQNFICEICLNKHSNECKFTGFCRVCRSARHNTLLHQEKL
jgi:Protein of unknown function (DUF1759)